MPVTFFLKKPIKAMNFYLLDGKAALKLFKN
jgi:hypothetical protein